MSLNTRTANRLDAIDAEAFEGMLKSHSWTIYEHRIFQELERKRDELEMPSVPEITDFNRGYIASLRMVLGLRTQILSEMKAQMKGKT